MVNGWNIQSSSSVMGQNSYYVEQKMKVKFKISKVLVDFEVAVAQAISKVWGASVKGCIFHFSQAIWRFCQTSKMVQCFSSCGEFREFIKMVMALSHVKLNDLQESMDFLQA